MEWMRTLGWILRGSPWGFALTVALFTALYILVPMESPPRGGGAVVVAAGEGVE